MQQELGGQREEWENWSLKANRKKYVETVTTKLSVMMVRDGHEKSIKKKRRI